MLIRFFLLSILLNIGKNRDAIWVKIRMLQIVSKFYFFLIFILRRTLNNLGFDFIYDF